ncbi:MAG: YidC/Oxa1 family membrane protein insertase [Dehalococcoidia bacterium]
MNFWELIIQQPLINVLILVASFFGGNFGVSIIALTIFINLCMLPLTLSQIRSAKKMQDIQPKMAELQKKYAKDRQKLAQEQMRLYKESGIKLSGCMLPMIIQLPVWIALYQSIMLAMAIAPEGLLNLSRFLYNWDGVFAALPLSRSFLGLNLGEPNIFLAIIVGISQWVQQKMSQTPSADPKQAQQNQMMLWMFPMVFTIISLTFPAGLPLYWVANSLVRIVLQYRLSGWGGLRRQPAEDSGTDKKYVDLISSAERKSTDDVGADIVVSDTQEKPGKNRYLPGKDRQKHRRKK